MEDKINLINLRLDELISKKDLPHKDLYKAAKYSLSSSGKRLRPLLVLLVLDTFKKDVKIGLDAACAIELIHTYSFIHDDLPCMDDDDMRRGKPSLHKAFPEWLAVLTGDFLLTFAFDVISNAKHLTSSIKTKLIQILAKRSGGDGLIAGQVIDLDSEDKKIDLELLKFMHMHKTADLFMSAVEFGSIIAKVSKKTSVFLKNFAKNLGLAFQMVDDILDVTSNDKTLGKPINSDLKNNKATAVSILGLEKAKKIAIQLHDEALDNLKKIKEPTFLLEKYLNNLISRIY